MVDSSKAVKGLRRAGIVNWAGSGLHFVNLPKRFQGDGASQITAEMDSKIKALSNLFTRSNLQMIPLVDPEKRIKRVITKDDITIV